MQSIRLHLVFLTLSALVFGWVFIRLSHRSLDNASTLVELAFISLYGLTAQVRRVSFGFRERANPTSRFIMLLLSRTGIAAAILMIVCAIAFITYTVSQTARDPENWLMVIAGAGLIWDSIHTLRGAVRAAATPPTATA